MHGFYFFVDLKNLIDQHMDDLSLLQKFVAHLTELHFVLLRDFIRTFLKFHDTVLEYTKHFKELYVSTVSTH